MSRRSLISAGLIVLVFAVFGQTRGFDFVNYDDALNVSRVLELHEGLSPGGLRWAFTTTLAGNYIPLTAVSYLADFAAHGLDPGGFHLTNVAFHAATVIFLFLFLVRTTGEVWPSALVAALFAVHPLRAESVAWISSRKDVVCGFFWMLTLHAYASYARKPGAARYALVFVSVCAALLAKSMAVTLPALLLLMDAWPLRRMTGANYRRLALEKLPLLVPVVAASIATMNIQRASGAMTDVGTLPWSGRLANAITGYARYLGKTIFPADLIPLYPFPEHGVPLTQVLAAILLVGAISAVVALAARRAPWAAVGWLWFLGTLVPVIGIVQVGAQSIADRYMYLPQIGLFVMIAWGAVAIYRSIPRSGPVLVAIAAASIITCGFVAHAQTKLWKDSVTLWSHTVAIAPDNVIAHASLGEAYIQKKQLDDARRELETALRLRPEYRPALVNLAAVAVEQGRFAEAITLCQAAEKIAPGDSEANTTWASALIRSGQFNEALAHADIALKTKPDSAEALSNKGAALLMLNRADEALPVLERATASSPNDAVILTNLAAAHFAFKHMDEARLYCDAALNADPSYEQALALRAALDAVHR